MTKGISIVIFTSIVLLTNNICSKRSANKKYERNQRLWDEYSKDMTYDEKLMCYNHWCKENKQKHGDNYYYLPRI